MKKTSWGNFAPPYKLCTILIVCNLFLQNRVTAQQKFDKQSPIVESQITRTVKTDVNYEWSPKEKIAESIYSQKIFKYPKEGIYYLRATIEGTAITKRLLIETK